MCSGGLVLEYIYHMQNSAMSVEESCIRKCSKIYKQKVNYSNFIYKFEACSVDLMQVNNAVNLLLRIGH